MNLVANEAQERKVDYALSNSFGFRRDERLA